MKQQTLSDMEYSCRKKKTKREEFLEIMLRNKLKDAGVTGVEVIHHPVSEIPGDCQIVVTHHELSGRAAQRAPQARIVPIKNFMGAPEYDALVEELAARGTAQTVFAPAEIEEKTGGKPILVERKNIILNCESESPEDIIRRCGRMMVDSGYAAEDYIEGMVQRDREFSVAIGCYVAIPHGIENVRQCVKKTGLVVLTYPQGIQWGDETVKLVIGIAALGEEHMDVLTVISEIAGSEEDTDALVSGADVDTLYKTINEQI